MTQKSTKKPILLCILDGWGIGDPNDKNNAIAQAKTPTYDRFLEQYPNSKLMTSGLDVGLPEGQMGNSEVGHMSIGAGRIIFQDFPRINNAIKDGSLENNPKLRELVANLQNSKKTCHLLGMLSDGGVHSHLHHITYVAELLAKNNINVVFHAFLDGRDVAQKSAIDYLEKIKNIKIATICGRHYAMDRDNNWDRVKPSCDAIISAIGAKNSDAITEVKNAYDQGITDEFIVPTVIGDYSGMEDGDALLFCNFRSDRVRQISNAILNPEFKEFETKNIKLSQAISFTKYSDELSQFYQILFPPIKVSNSLPEVLSKESLTQLRIAETEKYAHVTFFFSCGKEQEFPGEKRLLVQSPTVTTYDLMPEMSAAEVGNNLRAAIKSGEFDFIVVNYANPDMVGHSGMLNASIKACEAIDIQLQQLEKAVLAQDGLMLITADHGNIECMLDEKQNPHTSHTTNPVPFILVGNDVSDAKLENGRLSDIAPTILQLLQVTQPTEMDGNNLIKQKSLETS